MYLFVRRRPADRRNQIAENHRQHIAGQRNEGPDRRDPKVALHINFATDKTDILADSQPQIAQVVQLLKEDAALELAVNRYIDPTGKN